MLILRLLGLLLTLFACFLAVPLLLSLYYVDGAHYAFLISIAITAALGLGLLALPRPHSPALRRRDGMLITVVSWLALVFCGSLPFCFAPLPLAPVDAWFEAMAGLTTTGSTIIARVEALPLSLLFYRQFLQWLGGMGIILLAVAVLPILGVAGMHLYSSEIPGPVKDTKLTPRITETAKLLWGIYLVLTLACILAYWLAGMNFFDAVTYSFSTVSIGGFTTHTSSFSYFDSSAIQLAAIAFMLFSAMNFSLHFYAWHSRSLAAYLKDPEWRFFSCFIIVITLLSLSLLWPQITSPDELVASIFQIISLVTTTGFTLENYNGFPTAVLFFLFIAAGLGCCAGSVGGGIKAIRVLMFIKQGYLICLRLAYPHGVFNLRLGGRIVPERMLEVVWGFFSIYLMSFLVFLVLLLISGMEPFTAWSAVVATFNNLGPGLGEVAQHYADIDAYQKLILSASMLVGRLEIFTFVVLLLPLSWH